MKRKTPFSVRFTALLLAWTFFMLPVGILAQTDIKAPKNKYKVEEDVKLGREAAAEAERDFPILNDGPATAYLEDVGRRLVASIPRQFRYPQFDYSFKIINARDINAFALPGGPMYVNRGMIESSKNEGEMAGVMAHEIAHVALRHGTAQATKMNSAWNQIIGIGAILGGAIIGGDTGAEVGAALYMGFLVLPYSRESETQADILGSRILADAGYDPRDLANMFRTIEKESGGSGPSWLSTHPAPKKRYETIDREAAMLDVDERPIKITEEFLNAKSRLKSYPKAKTLAEIEEEKESGKKPSKPDDHSSAGNGYKTRVDLPSASMRRVANGNWITMNVPQNWRDFQSEESIEFAPDGAHGNDGITHGMMIGVYRGSSSDLYGSTREYVDATIRNNSYLRVTSRYERQSVINRQDGFVVSLEGVSPVTGKTELVMVYTTYLRNGDMFYAITVVPEPERRDYNSTFRQVLESIRLYY